MLQVPVVDLIGFRVHYDGAVDSSSVHPFQQEFGCGRRLGAIRSPGVIRKARVVGTGEAMQMGVDHRWPGCRRG